WSVPRSTASARKVAPAPARRAQPGLWIRRAVARRLEEAWVHGQVVALAGDRVVVHHGKARSECGLSALVLVDPITALLLWDVEFPRSSRISQLRQYHTQLLNQLLGALGRAESSVSRNIAKILASIVSKAACPPDEIQRALVEVTIGVERQSPLQHAVDCVYVTDGAAVQTLKVCGQG
ncbi:hypothetical protein PHMEG_00027411, partial [Phytophthora megakarya]